MLEAVPKGTNPGYVKVLLYLAAPTAHVVRALVIDSEGDRERIELTDERLQ